MSKEFSFPHISTIYYFHYYYFSVFSAWMQLKVSQIEVGNSFICNRRATARGSNELEMRNMKIWKSFFLFILPWLTLFFLLLLFGILVSNLSKKIVQGVKKSFSVCLLYNDKNYHLEHNSMIYDLVLTARLLFFFILCEIFFTFWTSYTEKNKEDQCEASREIISQKIYVMISLKARFLNLYFKIASRYCHHPIIIHCV